MNENDTEGFTVQKQEDLAQDFHVLAIGLYNVQMALTLVLGILLPFAYLSLIKEPLLSVLDNPLPVEGLIALGAGFLLLAGHFGIREIESLVNAWHARGYKASRHRGWLAAQSAAGLSVVQAHLTRTIQLNLDKKVASVLILPNGIYRLRFAAVSSWVIYALGIFVAMYFLGESPAG